MWEQQLASMVDGNHLDQTTISDFGVTYAAEMGDGSIFGSLTFLELMPKLTACVGSASQSVRCGRHKSYSIDRVARMSVSISQDSSGQPGGVDNRSVSSSTSMSWAGSRLGIRAWSESKRG